MVSLDLAKLDGLHQQAGEAELGELARMRLIVLLLPLRVSADVEHARHRLLHVCGQVEIAGHVEARKGLIVQILNAVAVAFGLPGDVHVQRRTLRKRHVRSDAHHFVVLRTPLLSRLWPVGGRRQ